MPTVWSEKLDRTTLVRRYEDGALAFSSRSTAHYDVGGSRDGVSNPSWRRQIARGQNATTNFTADETVLHNVPISGYLTVPKQTASQVTTEYVFDGGTNSLGDATLSLSFPSYVSSLVETSAREQFLSKYRQARTAFQSGVFLGELGKTVRMIMNPARSLRSALDDYRRSLKKRNRMSRPDYRRYVADSWLEWSYGVRPLVRDVKDACSLACASPSRYSEPIQAFGVYDIKEPTSFTRSAPSIGHPRWTEYISAHRSYKVRYKGAAKCQNSPPSFPEQLGLSWSNVLPTAWELIPFSFLVDYFTNVGMVIDGVSTGTVQLAWGVKTVRKDCTSTLVSATLDTTDLDNFGSRKPFGYVNGAGVIGHKRTVVRTRIDAVSLSILDFRFRLPGVDSLKWLNLAGLAAMRF